MGKPESKRTLGTPRRRWEDYIKINIQEVGIGGGGTCNGLICLRIGTDGEQL